MYDISIYLSIYLSLSLISVSLSHNKHTHTYIYIICRHVEKIISGMLSSPNCAHPRLQWALARLQRRLDSWLQSFIAEYDVCLVLGTSCLCKSDPLRKKQGETRQMGCVQDFKIKQRSHATSSRMASPRTARGEWKNEQRKGKRKNKGHGCGMGSADERERGKVNHQRMVLLGL